MVAMTGIATTGMDATTTDVIEITIDTRDTRSETATATMGMTGMDGSRAAMLGVMTGTIAEEITGGTATVTITMGLAIRAAGVGLLA